jgi:hypothetical protein
MKKRKNLHEYAKIKKKAIFLFIGIIIIALMILTSCAKDIEVSTEDGLLANNDIADFYFYYPAGFTLDKNASMISVYATDDELIPTDIPRDDEMYHVQVHPNFSVSVLGIPETYESIDEYWVNYCLPLYEKTFSEIEITDTEDVKINDCDAKRYNYTVTLAGMEFQYAQVIIKRGDSLYYTMLYTASPKKFDKYINVLDTAISTFRFK